MSLKIENSRRVAESRPVCMDLKAFDSINHTILLHKLKCVGASPLAIQWFESYLSGRSQYVRIGSTNSTNVHFGGNIHSS